MENKTKNKICKLTDSQEDSKLGFIFSNRGFYVEKIKDLFHVFIPGITHAVCDSAYEEEELAITRCKYLSKMDS